MDQIREKQFVGQMKEKDVVDSIFLTNDKQVLKDKNGKEYMSVNLVDLSGSINARLWEKVADSSEIFESGDFVRVKGHVQVYQNRRQLVIHHLRVASTEEYRLSDFLISSEKPPEDMLVELNAIVDDVIDKHLSRLLKDVISDPEIQPLLLKSPAAKSIHHAYVGGLLEHILSISKIMEFLAVHYPFLDKDWLIFGAIFHDIGKLWELKLDQGISYTDEGRLVGHMTIACELIDRKTQDIPDFPNDIKLLCKHIVLSHHGKLEYGSPKRPKTLEAYIVSMIDELDSRINTLKGFLEAELSEGDDWSRYHKDFDRYFYLKVLKSQL